MNFTNPYSVIPYYGDSRASSLADATVMFSQIQPSAAFSPSNFNWSTSYAIRLRSSGYPNSFLRFANSLSFPVSCNIDLSNKNFQEFSFSYSPQASLIWGDYLSRPNFRIQSPSCTVTFSDGTSQNIIFSNFVNRQSLDFSFSKKPGSSQYLLSSEDFNISANPEYKDSGLTFKSRSDNAQNMPTDELFLSNVTVKGARIENGRSSGLNNSFYASGDFNNITIPQNVILGTANLTTGAISATASGRVALSLGNFSLSLAIMYIDRLILPEISSTTAGVSVKNAEFEIAGKAVIDEAPVTIIPASDDVIITRIVCNFNIVILNSNIQDAFTSKNHSSDIYFYLVFAGTAFCSSSSGSSDIVLLLSDIRQALRVDLPNSIRHLLIPTQEEVKDVLEESFDNIAEEYPGAAGTITTIKGQFTDFNAAISGSSTRGLVLPGITVSIPGSDRKVKLWEDFDLLPYLQTGPARSLMYWVELMLKALIFIYLVRQAASMFISAVTGYSYLEWFGLSNKPFMGDDGLGEALPEGYLEREVG